MKQYGFIRGGAMEEAAGTQSGWGRTADVSLRWRLSAFSGLLRSTHLTL
ncbi:MAG: hypothetical protein JW846_10385 [Dehalococcoidia bacterium]|nr:hypothetical protein [Dehalococcoidia bacterium]